MRHLFMLSSEATRTLQKLFILLISVATILLITDWLVGRLIPYITTEPPFILRFANVPGVEALWAFSEAEVKPIIFTGSSQTYTGISPHVFNERLKSITHQDINSVNVSVVGSVVTVERDVIRNLIIPNHPQIIFYGIEMRALKTESQDEDYYLVSDFRNKVLGNAVSQPTPIRRDILVWLLKHSNLIQYRDNFRDWLSGIRLINKGEELLTSVDDLGFAPFPNKIGQSEANIISQFIPFTVDEATRQKLIDIGINCQQSGVQCILLNTPLHELAYQYITPSEEALYQNALAEAKLPIWDFNTGACRKLFGNASFFNLNHLNIRGAEKFSQMIADVYANVFFNTPLSGDAGCAKLSS